MKTFNVKLFVFLCICLFALPFKAFASCSCTAPGTYELGYEYAAFNCPEDGDDGSTKRKYEYVSIKCVDGVIKTALTYVPNTAGTFTESEIIDRAKWYGNFTKILTNESRTHVIAIYKAWSGVKIEGVSASVGTTEADVFNKICTPDVGNMPDSDSDDFPDCFDCDPEDSNHSLDCPVAEISLKQNFGPKCGPCGE